jgi:hypothetical protein
MSWVHGWGANALLVLGVVLCCGGIDCLATGWRDLRSRGGRAFDREVGLWVLLTGAGLCACGALALWGASRLR